MNRITYRSGCPTVYVVPVIAYPTQPPSRSLCIAINLEDFQINVGLHPTIDITVGAEIFGDEAWLQFDQVVKTFISKVEDQTVVGWSLDVWLVDGQRLENLSFDTREEALVFIDDLKDQGRIRSYALYDKACWNMKGCNDEVREKPCRHCPRKAMNDIGARVCWACGGADPCA